MKCDETQCHTILCDGWKEQREGLDRTQMKYMVIFFTRLLEEKGLKRDWRVRPRDRPCRAVVDRGLKWGGWRVEGEKGGV